MKKNARYLFGLYAEKIVALRYFLTGHRVIATRMRNYAGEIDLIVSRGNSLIFIEVKGRKKIDIDIISKQQQQRIMRAASLFIAHNQKYQNYDIRFDLVVVKDFWNVTIIKNAFM